MQNESNINIFVIEMHCKSFVVLICLLYDYKSILILFVIKIVVQYTISSVFDKISIKFNE